MSDITIDEAKLKELNEGAEKMEKYHAELQAELNSKIGYFNEINPSQQDTLNLYTDMADAFNALDILSDDVVAALTEVVPELPVEQKPAAKAAISKCQKDLNLLAERWKKIQEGLKKRVEEIKALQATRDAEEKAKAPETRP